MKITEQEQEQRKNRIINKAFELFCERGIEKVTLSDIARASGVGDSTIYRYFSNKPQLVLATLSVLWKSIGEAMELQVEAMERYEEMTGLEQFACRLEGCRNLYLENSGYVLFSYESKLYLQRNGIQLTKQQYDDLMEQIHDPCIRALEKGMADGTIPVDMNSEDLFYAIWGSIRGYIVKIVIYKALCVEESPWESRYSVVEDGILSALSAGWKHPGIPGLNRDRTSESIGETDCAEKHEY